jgi:hypothetical protein
MTQLSRLLPALALVLAVSPASAQGCYAEYKAKQDNPLRLDHGVIALTDCSSPAQIEAAVRSRLAAAGWTLLKVVSVSAAPPGG